MKTSSPFIGGIIYFCTMESESLQNLGKDFIPSNMHTTVVTKNGEIVRLAKSLCKMYVHGIPNPEEKSSFLTEVSSR